MRIKSLFCILLVALLTTGCQATKRDTGAILGGIAGGVLGNQIGKGDGRTVAIIAGSLAGAYLGGTIGAKMDENDQYRSQQALEENPVNQTSSWSNPDTGNSYDVTPTRTYQASSGPCREYTTQAVINGQSETIYGNACRQPDGSWQTVN